jgi:uncharacterized protein YbaP (TraB family)
MVKANFYPLSLSIEKAYAQADMPTVEADVTNVEVTKNATPLMSYVAPDKLQRHLTLAT